MAKSASALQRSSRIDDATPFADDVLAGLAARPKRLDPKYFYDSIGSQLFERITQQPEYYLTRCELSILEENAAAISALLPEGGILIEFGSGSSRKVRTLLSAARSVAAYAPVDISAAMLAQEAHALRGDFPGLIVEPVSADFTRMFDVPKALASLPRAGFFPGSTIGNFEPHEAADFLRRAGTILGRGATFIIGVDLLKAPDVLNAAYNDAAGTNAEFNLNLLARINRELGGNFDVRAFEHHAFFKSERSRVEMHLASIRLQKVRVCGRTFAFRAGETIHTENSYKYSIESFRALARGADWQPTSVWTDRGRQFSVHALTFTGDGSPARAL